MACSLWKALFFGVATLWPAACGYGSARRDSSLNLRTCHVAELAEAVTCGTWRVAENRTSPTGRTIDIQFAVLPALRRARAAEPLVMFAGGPGQGARAMAAAVDRHLRRVRRTRDVLLVDLRGTGDSQIFTCMSPEDDVDAVTDVHWLERDVPSCLAASPVDPRQFTHAAALADLDEIRARLGYERVDAWGGSWGTRAALLYAARYPTRVRRLVLDGAVPLDMGFPSSASRDAQRALDLVVAGCEASIPCRARYPDAAGLVRTLDVTLQRAPFTARVRHPRTGAFVTKALPREAVVETLRGALYTPQDAALVLWLIERALDGDVAPLLAQATRTASWSTDQMALGTTLSVLCSEDLAGARETDYVAEARASVFGAIYADAWRGRCRMWPTGTGRDDVDREVQLDAAALVLSGVHDPVTPPGWGERMMRHFSQAQHVVVDAAAHNASFTGCTPDLIADFLDGDGHTALDTSCLAGARWPGVVLDASGVTR